MGKTGSDRESSRVGILTNLAGAIFVNKAGEEIRKRFSPAFLLSIVSIVRQSDAKEITYLERSHQLCYLALTAYTDDTR